MTFFSRARRRALTLLSALTGALRPRRLGHGPRHRPGVARRRGDGGAARGGGGNRRDAIERLTALYERDRGGWKRSTRLIAVIGPHDPGLAASYVMAGRRLIELREPVSHVYERDRCVPRGRLDALAIARFEAAVSRSTR